jgi:hypothetical protein
VPGPLPFKKVLFLYLKIFIYVDKGYNTYTYNCIVIYNIKEMASLHIIREVGANKYNVFSVENTNKKSKNWKKKMYIVSTHDDPNTLLSMIRSMAKSKTAGGASKVIGQDMASAGKDYKEKFLVKKVSQGVTKEKAEDIKSKNIDRTGHAKVYNQLNPIN